MPTMRYATSPLLASRTPVWRVKFLIGGIGLGFAVLIGRAAWIQIIHNDFFQEQGANRYERRIELQANRGRILDRNGELLASSVPSPSLWAIPKDLKATPQQVRELARLLKMPQADLQKRLKSNPNFVWLRRKVDDEVAQSVAALKIKGVYELREWKRQYPEGEAAAHVVGFTNIEDEGQEGIELAYQNQLAGRDGSRHVIKDRLGRAVESVGELVPAENGQAVQLSLDAKIQFYAYQSIRDAVKAHKAKAGSVVVLDAVRGEVLALANVPSYTPEDRRNLTGAQLRNRALTDTFEPGSTMKPITVALALETRRVRPSTVMDTASGRLTIDGSTISDTHPKGDLTVAQVIQKSSNVGTAKMALMMQPREMWEMFSAVGLGKKPQLGFPGAVTGRLRPYKSWRRIEQVTMSYGYGLSSSLFQIAQAYSIFASDGELIPMTLIKRDQGEGERPTLTAEGDDPRPTLAFKTAFRPEAVASHPASAAQTEPVQVRGTRVISPETARAVREMLQLTTGPGGTAPRAQALGYSVGGKTGTAHKQEGRGYASNKYRSWFVGIAPISKPRIIVAVMVDEPGNGQYYGGLVAAPVFSQVVQQTLNRLGVLPDVEVQSQIISTEPGELESF
ncbi:MAG: cell division protein [Burkholderiales bacterium RIFCSPLOWO2_12_FULL_64_99]|nr:penicillin-binding protein 2 [Aquabacterium sp.]OGB03380.1 MAG: cell division protein [Burkholderiales bacterium RIFCSPHIGHO2_12_FULL_63_20]OGB67390.1 MAG: cell division protein [Burkholderiales bacterium RIFCSPLOWO2_12_FULL_64_99]